MYACIINCLPVSFAYFERKQTLLYTIVAVSFLFFFKKMQIFLKSCYSGYFFIITVEFIPTIPNELLSIVEIDSNCKGSFKTRLGK